MSICIGQYFKFSRYTLMFSHVSIANKDDTLLRIILPSLGRFPFTQLPVVFLTKTSSWSPYDYILFANAYHSCALNTHFP